LVKLATAIELRILSLGSHENRNIRVGVLPERKGFLILRPRPLFISLYRQRSRQLKLCESLNLRGGTSSLSIVIYARRGREFVVLDVQSTDPYPAWSSSPVAGDFVDLRAVSDGCIRQIERRKLVNNFLNSKKAHTQKQLEILAGRPGLEPG
jgi:hypothetical protein